VDRSHSSHCATFFLQKKMSESVSLVAKLRDQRVEVVRAIAQHLQASSILDVGSGEGRFVRALAALEGNPFVFGIDTSPKRYASTALGRQSETKTPLHLANCNGDFLKVLPHLLGFDLAICVEVIEHLAQSELASFESLFFRKELSKTWVVTSPNQECNHLLAQGGDVAKRLRCSDHKFEFTRTEFHTWVQHICSKFDLSAAIGGIGQDFDVFGRPTNLAFFALDKIAVTRILQYSINYCQMASTRI